MKPTPIVLDCDPGHDDALAMILAAYNPAINLLAITTVSGNGIIAKRQEGTIRDPFKSANPIHKKSC